MTQMNRDGRECRRHWGECVHFESEWVTLADWTYSPSGYVPKGQRFSVYGTTDWSNAPQYHGDDEAAARRMKAELESLMLARLKPGL